MMRGRPRNIDNIDELKKVSFGDFDELILMYLRIIRDVIEDPEVPEANKIYYKAFLELPRYLLNIMILKAEFRETKKIIVILHMEDEPLLVNSAIQKAKKLIKEYVKLSNNISDN